MDIRMALTLNTVEANILAHFLDCSQDNSLEIKWILALDILVGLIM